MVRLPASLKQRLLAGKKQAEAIADLGLCCFK